MATETQTVQVEKEITGKTVVSIDLPTPMWATWVFRTEFVLNKAILFILSGTSLLTPEQVKESLVWIAGIDLLIWGIGRGLGVKKQAFEDEAI